MQNNLSKGEVNLFVLKWYTNHYETEIFSIKFNILCQINLFDDKWYRIHCKVEIFSGKCKIIYQTMKSTCSFLNDIYNTLWNKIIFHKHQNYISNNEINLFVHKWYIVHCEIEIYSINIQIIYQTMKRTYSFLIDI